MDHPYRKVKLNKLKGFETLAIRFMEGIEAETVEHYRNIVQHFINQFDNCRNKVTVVSLHLFNWWRKYDANYKIIQNPVVSLFPSLPNFLIYANNV